MKPSALFLIALLFAQHASAQDWRPHEDIPGAFVRESRGQDAFWQGPALAPDIQITQAYIANTGHNETLPLVINRKAGDVIIQLNEREGTIVAETGSKSAVLADGRVVLSASDAVVVGDTAALESDAGNHRIGFWTNSSDTVRWDWEYPRWGSLEVELTYSLAGTKPNKIAVALGEQALEGEILPTGSWYRYATVSLGRVTLGESGKQTLMVRSVLNRGAAVMNLKAVTLRPAPEGEVIRQAEDGTILLKASDGIAHGTMLRYEPKAEKNCFGYWVNERDWAEWRFSGMRSGKYAVHLVQGCGKGQGGSAVEIRMGEQRLTFEVEDTGHFQAWRERTLGEVMIVNDGPISFQVRPLKKAKAAVMDIREVRLIPVP